MAISMTPAKCLCTASEKRIALRKERVERDGGKVTSGQDGDSHPPGRFGDQNDRKTSNKAAQAGSQPPRRR